MNNKINLGSYFTVTPLGNIQIFLWDGDVLWFDDCGRWVDTSFFGFGDVLENDFDKFVYLGE